MTTYDLAGLDGLVFVHPQSGEEFGLIRAFTGVLPEFFPSAYRPVAEDESGNCFVASAEGSILFWDHETGDLTPLAPSWDAFRADCGPPRPVPPLDPARVRSVWVDPSFAKTLGIDVPPDGWVKRKDS
jgi:hypothetical protein